MEYFGLERKICNKVLRL